MFPSIFGRAPVAQYDKRWPADLAVSGLSPRPLEAKIFPTVNEVLRLTTCFLRPIVLSDVT